MIKVRTTYTNNLLYKKNPRVIEKINRSKKIKLSLMDEKLSILNSNIEELYKKYIEKKKIRKRKEKSELNLVSKIKFLIEEEKKIRNQLENKSAKKDFFSKNKSDKSFRIRKTLTTSGTMIYNTLENSEDGKYKFYNTTKGNRKIKYKNNLNMSNKDNINNNSSTKNSDSKKNEINDITLRKKQSNSIEDKGNNIIIKSKANVTNNVCIIINNTDKNESKDDINNKNIINNASFSNVDNINEDNKKNKYIKITDNVSDSNRANIKQNFIDNKDDYYYNSLVSNNSNENDIKIKLNKEINYIKMALVSKLKEENIQLLQKKENMKLNNLNENENEAIKENNNRTENENNNEYTRIDDKIKTSSFEIKMKDQNQKKNKSLKNILNFRLKELKNFEKGIEKKKTIQLKRYKIGIREKLYPNINKDNNNNENGYKKEILKNLDKRCYSKPINTIRVKNKGFKTFNHKNLNKTLDKNKSYREREINKKVKREIKINEFNNLSIDSNEIILSDANVNTFLERMKSTKKAIDKPINAIYYKKSKNFMEKNQKNGEKIFYDCDSTSNLINSTNLTFNKSIEKKKHLLGLPINVKLNSNLKKKISETNKFKDNIISKKENKNKIWRKTEKKEEKNSKNNSKINKPLKTFFYQRNKNSLNKDNKSTIAKKKMNKNNNSNNVQKDIDYDKETYSNYNNFDSNSFESQSQLFKAKFNFKKHKIKDKTAYVVFNNSLSSTFSNKTNKTSLTNNINYAFKNKDSSNINKSNNNDLSNYNQIKNNTNSKGYIFVTKNENKDFLSTIRLVKKRVKYIDKLKQIEEGEKKEGVFRNVNHEFRDNDSNKLKSKEKNIINPKKELAVIRRINQIKETYKNKGTQITNMNKKYENKFSIDLNDSNICNNNKKKVYQFQTYRRLSQIQKNHSYSFSNSGSFFIVKSKSNRSLLNENKSLESFKI